MALPPFALSPVAGPPVLLPPVAEPPVALDPVFPPPVVELFVSDPTTSSATTSPSCARSRMTDGFRRRGSRMISTRYCVDRRTPRQYMKRRPFGTDAMRSVPLSGHAFRTRPIVIR